MIVQLYHRHYGQHSLIKECEIVGTFRRYSKKITNTKWWMEPKYEINEELLLSELPKGFLISEPNKTLLTYSEGEIATGLSDLKKFKSWSKYHDSYTLMLIKRKK